MKILFAGIIARYPYGGVTWCSLMYLLGLQDLGHEVLYIEDTGECIYDARRDTISTDPAYGTRYIHDALEPFGLGELDVNGGGKGSTARVRMSHGDGPPMEASGKGDGPIAAAFSAIDELIDATVEIEDFEIVAATPGRDAIGEVNLHARVGGRA